MAQDFMWRGRKLTNIQAILGAAIMIRRRPEANKFVEAYDNFLGMGEANDHLKEAGQPTFGRQNVLGIIKDHLVAAEAEKARLTKLFQHRGQKSVRPQ